MTSTEFDQLTPAQKRVVIAEDVVKHIRARDAYQIGKLRVLEIDDDCTIHADKISRDNIAQMAPHCCVCAKGAMMLSRIMCFGGFTYNDNIFDDDQQAIDSLEEFFDPLQLDLIEAAFEGMIFGWHCERHGDDDGFFPDDIKTQFDRAVAFFHRYEGASIRLLAIMQNIISNQGIFLP